MPTNFPPNISIVIPAYQEEKSIGPVLRSIVVTMSKSEIEYEVIVVDDGSTDRTQAIATEIAQECNTIKIVSHVGNRGYGASLKTGIRRAQYNLIGITDADGTYPNERIPEFIDVLIESGYDMLVGARIGEHVHIPLARRPAKWMISQLAVWIAGAPIPDLNSGMRIFKRDVVIRFFNLLPQGFSFTTTITLGMLSSGYHVGYRAINYQSRIGKSKIRPIRDTLNFIGLILRMGLYFAPLKIFLPVGFMLILGAVIWGIMTALLGRLADVSTLVLMIAGFQTTMLGLLAELVNHRLPNDYRER